MTDSGDRGKCLPGKDAVLAACRGLLCTDNPVLESARELATVHELRWNLLLSIDDIVEYGRYRELGRIMDWAELVHSVIDERRRTLVVSIDEWVEFAVPPARPRAPLQAETVGDVIDRLALLTVQTYVELTNQPVPAALTVHAELDTLGAAYERLVCGLSAGLRRLPSTKRFAETDPF
ncbi:DUF4254 domain-containing protein [Nocardia sp. NPDC004573]